MSRPYQYCRAYVYYLRTPILSFLPFLGLLVIVLIIGTFCFHFLYTHKRLSYAEAFYITYCLIWVEHLMEFPGHWLLRIFYFVLPPLGFLVFLDVVVRFSYHILRGDETGEEWIRSMCKTLNNHVVLCGLGKLGLRTLQQLIRLGETVAVLKKNPQCPNLAFARQERHSGYDWATVVRKGSSMTSTSPRPSRSSWPPMTT